MLRRAGVLLCAGTLAAVMTVVLNASPAAADGTFSVAPTTLNFGEVAVGTTKTIPVVITNVGNTSASPAFSGGAPLDPTHFGGSQNCAGKTFAPGASCQFEYEFTPVSEGPHNTSTTIGIDATNYAITMTGVGTSATATTTSPTTAPTTPTTGGGGGGGGGGNTPLTTAPGATTTVPNPALEVEIEHDPVEPGDDESASIEGLQPKEIVSAVMQPGAIDLGSRVADDEGDAEFTWEIDDDTPPGVYEFVATGATSGTVRASFTVAEDDDDSGISPWLIALIVLVVLALIAAVVYAVRGRRGPGPEAEPTTPASS